LAAAANDWPKSDPDCTQKHNPKNRVQEKTGEAQKDKKIRKDYVPRRKGKGVLAQAGERITLGEKSLPQQIPHSPTGKAKSQQEYPLQEKIHGKSESALFVSKIL